MKRHHLLIFGSLVLAAGLATGGYVLWRWLTPPPTGVGPIDIHDPRRHETAALVPKVSFRDITEKAGLRFRHTNGATPQKLLPETMSGGVAVLDYDNDGRQDLLFVNSCEWPGGQGSPTPALYRNRGDGTFEDVTAAAGLNVTFYGMGVTAGDYDNDGFLDVFVSGVGEQHLFHNEGGQRFTDVTDKMGLNIGRLPNVSREEFLKWEKPIPFGSSCTWVDYDGDGRLDLFVCHYVTWSPKIDLTIGAALVGGDRAYVQPRDFEGALCSLYRNAGDRFVDVSAAAGVQVTEPEGTGPNARRRSVGKSLGVIVCDADEDGWPDLLVANDTVRNFYFHNRGDGTFEEDGYRCGAAYAEGTPRGGMGIDVGEYRPGKCAVVIANFANEPDTFLKIDRNPTRFTDAAVGVGVAGASRALLKFGTFFFDYDLDGRLDLLTCNGHIEPDIARIQKGQTYAQPAQLFWNTGAERGLTYEPVSADKAGTDLFQPLVGRGSAFLDLDKDGWLDVVLAANGGPPRLLHNEGKSADVKNHWARLVLTGDGKTSNRSAIGARLTIKIGDRELNRQVTAGRGYLSQSELPITVGLGDAVTIDKVTVRWPGRDAKPEVFTDLAAGREHPLEQGKGKPAE